MIAFHGEKFRLTRLAQEIGRPLSVIFTEEGPAVEFHNEGDWDLANATWLILATDEEFQRTDIALQKEPEHDGVPASVEELLVIYRFFYQETARSRITWDDSQDIHARAMDLTKAWVDLQGARDADAMGHTRERG